MVDCSHTRQRQNKEELFMDNKVMYSLSYGLFVLSARRGDKDNG